jgi:hypothetical protein
VRSNRVAGEALSWAMAFYAVFCTAVLALVTWVRYRMMIEDRQAGRLQATVLRGSPQALVIQTTGPFGVTAYELDAGRIRSIEVGRGRVCDQEGRPHHVPRLLIRLEDQVLALLPGREMAELHWVARLLRRALGKAD